MFSYSKSCIVYELAITNADKGKIDLQNIHDRIKPMLEQNFTICITNLPFFTYKNRFISNSVYAIGMDTCKFFFYYYCLLIFIIKIKIKKVIRILDKKYYAFS